MLLGETLSWRRSVEGRPRSRPSSLSTTIALPGASGAAFSRGFYMEISFHFKSSIILFVGKITPSGMYQIWKRHRNLRADTSLAGFDSLKIQCANQSFLFIGEGDESHDVPKGLAPSPQPRRSKIFNALESAGVGLANAKLASLARSIREGEAEQARGRIGWGGAGSGSGGVRETITLQAEIYTRGARGRERVKNDFHS